MKTERLMRQMLKVRPQTWGRMTWVSKYLQVTPNSPVFDPAVADFLLGCVFSVDKGTGS